MSTRDRRHCICGHRVEEHNPGSLVCEAETPQPCDCRKWSACFTPACFTPPPSSQDLHRPLTYPADRSALIQRACEADDSSIAAGAFPLDVIEEARGIVRDLTGRLPLVDDSDHRYSVKRIAQALSDRAAPPPSPVTREALIEAIMELWLRSGDPSDVTAEELADAILALLAQGARG